MLDTETLKRRISDRKEITHESAHNILENKIKNKEDFLKYADMIINIQNPSLILAFTFCYEKMIEEFRPELFKIFAEEIKKTNNLGYIESYVSYIKGKQECYLFVDTIIDLMNKQNKYFRLEYLFKIGEQFNIQKEIAEKIIATKNKCFIKTWYEYIESHLDSYNQDKSVIENILLENLFSNADIRMYDELKRLKLNRKDYYEYSKLTINSLIKSNTNVETILNHVLYYLALTQAESKEKNIKIIDLNTMMSLVELIVKQRNFKVISSLINLNKMCDGFISIAILEKSIGFTTKNPDIWLEFIFAIRKGLSQKALNELEFESNDAYVDYIMCIFRNLLITQNNKHAMSLIIKYCEHFGNKDKYITCFDAIMKKLSVYDKNLYLLYISRYSTHHSLDNCKDFIKNSYDIKLITSFIRIAKKSGIEINEFEYRDSIIDLLRVQSANNINSKKQLNAAYKFTNLISNKSIKKDVYQYLYKINPDYLINKVSARLLIYWENPTLFIEYLISLSSDPDYELMLKIFYDKLYASESLDTKITIDEIIPLVKELFDNIFKESKVKVLYKV